MNRTLKIFSEHKTLSIVILAAAILSILSLVSYMFWDQIIFSSLKQNTKDIDGPLIVKAVTLLGKAWLLIWLLLCWALIAKCPQKTLIPMTAMFLLIFTVLPLKAVVQRPRPRDVNNNHTKVDGHANNFRNGSFPSGDTATSFAVAVSITPFIGWFARCTFYILAGCVGLLRLACFAHYLSDIFAGAVVGVFAAYLAQRLIMARPSLKSDLLKMLNSYTILVGVIVIPLMVGIFNGLDELWVFCLFYPPIVMILYLLSRANSTNWNFKIQN